MRYVVIPATRLDLAPVGLGSTMLVPLRMLVEVGGAREATLEVKVIDRSFSGQGSTPALKVQLYPQSPVGALFPFTSPTPVLEVDLWGQSGPSSFTLYRETGTELGGLVGCVLSYTQYDQAVTSANVTLAVDLVQKA